MLPISACTTANDRMDSFHFTNEDSPICHKYNIFTIFFQSMGIPVSLCLVYCDYCYNKHENIDIVWTV